MVERIYSRIGYLERDREPGECKEAVEEFEKEYW